MLYEFVERGFEMLQLLWAEALAQMVHMRPRTREDRSSNGEECRGDPGGNPPRSTRRRHANDGIGITFLVLRLISA